MIKALSLSQFTDILEEIEKNHCLITGRGVKYVDSSFDFRTNSIWQVVMRPFGQEKVFTVANRIKKVKGEYVDEVGSLYDEIMTWLNEGLSKKRKKVKNV